MTDLNRAIEDQMIEMILADGILTELSQEEMDAELIRQLLADEQLDKLDLLAVAKMNVEELISRMLIDDGQNTEEEPLELSQEPENKPVALSEGSGERISIFIDGLAVEAKIVLNSAAAGENSPSETEIYQALANRGIISGIKEPFVERLAAYPVYDRRFKIAEGGMPINGEDGQAIFHFDTSVQLTPNVTDGDIVDYKELDFAKNVKKGEVLCDLIPPTKGQEGRSIFGGPLPGSDGSPTPITCGNNTRLSEDGRQILADCDGQVFLKDNKICVSRVMTVDNVDTSTGNIFFVGTINIRGDVRSGFTVCAGGDIIVKGAVESAVLTAGNHIILANGINGKDGGHLKAGGDVRASFIENTKVEAKGSVSADVILNSTVTSGSKIMAVGRRGYLIGGEYTAKEEIFAYDIGSPAYIPTKVTIASTENRSTQQAELLAQIAQYQEGIDKLKQIADVVHYTDWEQKQQQATLIRAAYLKQQMEGAIAQLSGENAEDVESGKKRTGLVSARNNLYPGVTVEINGASTVNKVLRSDCMLRNKAGIITAGKF